MRLTLSYKSVNFRGKNVIIVDSPGFMHYCWSTTEVDKKG